MNWRQEALSPQTPTILVVRLFTEHSHPHLVTRLMSSAPRMIVSVAHAPHCLAWPVCDPLAGCSTADQPGRLRGQCQLRGNRDAG